MEMGKAMIAMSGGVDSSVAAYLMQQSGFSCIGATMHLYDNEMIALQSNSCCSLEDAEDARSVARRLGMPFYVMNAKDAFEKKVIAPFVRCYEQGLTPNPCIECNRHLKFDFFLHRAEILGCDCIATGHYARIRRDAESGRYLLYKALDKAKDQSYVLYCLSQQQLAHVRFPLGDMTKEEVRRIAEAQGFLNAKKHDSQDICFVPDGDYVAFMGRYTGREYPPGDFLNRDGQPIGRHRGAVRYTIGQRKGLGLAMGEPVYVCGKDMAANTVTVGAEDALYAASLLADDWTWFPFPALTRPMAVSARCRYHQPEQPATVYPEADGRARVVFAQPQRAMTPGQAVVLYQGDMVVGGGTISEILS